MEAADGVKSGDGYYDVAVCKSDETWHLERWEDLTDEELPQTHLVKADELLVRDDADIDLGPEWLPDTTIGTVTLYKRVGGEDAPPLGEPRSGVRVMTAVRDHDGIVDPNIVFCSQGLRTIEEPVPGEPVGPFRVAPRYQGIWSEGAKAAEGPENPQARARTAGPTIQIGIVDTGLAQGQFLTSWLESFIAGQWIVSIADGDPPDIDGNARIETPAGHGTFVAGVIAQSTPRVELHVVRAVDRQGAVSDDHLAKAIDRLVEETGGALDILNLSLGAWTYLDRQPRAVSERIESLPDRTLVVAAAGNLGGDREFWPAAMAQVVGVGAVIRDAGGWARAEYSNYGGWVKAVAHDGGTRVPEGESQGHQVSAFYTGFAPFDGWAAWRGTSFTTPKVAGRIAGTMLAEGLGSRAAWERLREMSPAAPSAFPTAVRVEDAPPASAA